MNIQTWTAMVVAAKRVQEERDSLKVQLQESERLRQEAFASCDAMRLELEQQRRVAADTCEALRASNDELRQELVAVTLERDEWKAGAEYQHQQAAQLRLQVEALESSVEDWQSANKKLAGQVADKQQQSQVLMRERDDRTAQLQSAIQRAADLQAQLEAEQQASEFLRSELAAAKNEASKTGWVYVGSHMPDREQLETEIVRLRNNWSREIDERKTLQQQIADLQAQLEAAAVTPAQQPDSGTVERLGRVQRMIGHVLGWYTCTDWFDEVERADAWEHVGELLGRLQREAG